MNPWPLAARVQTLQRVSAFAAVPEGALVTLAAMVRTERFAEGEAVARTGEAAEHVFVLAEGRLRVEREDGAFLRELVPVALLGEYGMFGDGQRTATVLATQPSVLLIVDYVRFRAFLIQFPSVLFALMEVAVERLQEAERGGRGGRGSGGSPR